MRNKQSAVKKTLYYGALASLAGDIAGFYRTGRVLCSDTVLYGEFVCN